MQVHNLDTGRVITLDPPEQFVHIPQPLEEGPPTVVTTVTAFNGPLNGVGGSYYTLAGDRVGMEGDDGFWEIPARFTDSGPLPPHVREQVEDIVPVVDRPPTVIGGDYRYSYQTFDGQKTAPSPTESDRQSQRRAHREQMDHVGETEAWDSRRRLPEGYGRGVGGDKWGRVHNEPTVLQVVSGPSLSDAVQGPPVPPPFLNDTLVRGGESR